MFQMCTYLHMFHMCTYLHTFHMCICFHSLTFQSIFFFIHLLLPYTRQRDIVMYASDDEVVLALRILRSFTFSHYILTGFVLEAVVPLLNSESELLREVMLGYYRNRHSSD